MPTQEASVEQAQASAKQEVQNIEEWCTGEIAAVRHQAKLQVEQAQAEARDW
jgi:hypothetical protein